MPTRREIKDTIQKLKDRACELELELNEMPDVPENVELVPIEIIGMPEFDITNAT